jgi:CO/xanthine dehydrogenase FAD-binding subunit
VTVAVPRTIDDAVAALAELPDAQVLAGGTDFMVEVNFGHRRPTDVVALRRVDELRTWSVDGTSGVLRICAGVTYAEMQQPPLAELVPALAQAARTVGSPQIRNAGTIGGNLATASPAGDTLPVLAALDATVVVAGPGGARRTLPWHEFLVGPKRNALEPGELVVAVEIPPVRGPQEFLKVGTRNAMVISVASVAVVRDIDAGTVRCALGSVGPTVIRTGDAEAWLATSGAFGEFGSLRIAEVTESVGVEFGRRVAAAARPIDDHRSTADYRRHAVEVCARRALERVLRA